LTDHKDLKESRDHIINKIREFKDDNNIIGYSFPCDLENYFYKPFLFQQEQAYLIWLNTLVTEIKSIDAATPVILEMNYRQGMEDEISWLQDHLLVDSFGLRVKDTLGLQNLLDIGKEKNISMFISNLDTKIFLQNPEKFKDQNFVLSNYQDEHYSNWVSFD